MQFSKECVPPPHPSLVNRNILVGLESGQIDSLFNVKKEEDDNDEGTPKQSGSKTKQEKKKPLINTLVGCKSIFTRHKANLAVVKQHPKCEAQFATGGCENELKIWDLAASDKMTFSARNVSWSTSFVLTSMAVS